MPFQLKKCVLIEIVTIAFVNARFKIFPNTDEFYWQTETLRHRHYGLKEETLLERKEYDCKIIETEAEIAS
jgi:hypothetical protein